MNNIKEAIAEMKHTKQFYSNDTNFNLEIKALNKQLPKKMAYYENGNYYRCPNCNSKYDNPQNEAFYLTKGAKWRK